MKDITCRFSKLFAIFLLVNMLYGCKKETLDDIAIRAESTSSVKSGDARSVKTVFEKRGYNTRLYDKYNETQQVYWQPVWADSTYKTLNDSTSYTFIPLRPKLVEIKTGRVIGEVNLLNNTKYVIVKQTDIASTFYLATYMKEGSDASIFDFSNFSGLLLLESFGSGDKTFIRYVGNKVSARYKGGRKKERSEISASGCSYSEVCYWYGDCGGGGVTGTSTSGSGMCPYPSVPGCGATLWHYSFSEWSTVCTEDLPGGRRRR